MSEIMPTKSRDSGCLEHGRPALFDVIEACSGPPDKDESIANGLLAPGLEGAQGLVIQRNVAGLSGLGPDPSYREHGPVRIHVAPPETEQLARRNACIHADDHHRRQVVATHPPAGGRAST